MPVDFHEPGPHDPLFEQARELGDANRRFIGHLTFDAWSDYASAGHVLVAVERPAGKILGYAAYRTPRNEIVLAHLVVHPDARRSGVARQIVEHLSEKYPTRRGISARCRTDYPADGMWPHLGFIPLGSSPGRSREIGRAHV